MNGTWVGCKSCEAPLIRGRFVLKQGQRAEIDISGLGFFELYVNGRKVSGDYLTPVWSDYGPREGRKIRYPIHDTFSHRVYFCRYDLSDYAAEGENVLEVLLGNGWYNQHERMAEGEMWYDRPKLWFDLRMSDGETVEHQWSGEQLVWRPSYIIYNNVYMGEHQDLRMESGKPGASLGEETQDGWEPVEPVPAPGGEMQLQTCPPDRQMRQIRPVLVGRVNGRRVYDAGENITGWVQTACTGEAGEKVVIRYAESLDANGELDVTSTGKQRQIQTNCYVSNGTAELCRPHFTWHGFRYFDVEGDIADPVICVVHSDVGVTGSFSCSDGTITWLVETYLRTRHSNMHCGVPMDCPHRERLGYTGDAQAACGADFWLLDCDLFYRKWMDDLADCQCKVSGHVQHTAPFYGGGGGPGGWGGAIVLVPWAHYRRYRDKELLRSFWPRMLAYVNYMRSRLDERGLVVREEAGGWCLGDWCAPEPMVLPEAFVNTYYLVKCMQIMRMAAEELGEAENAAAAQRKAPENAVMAQPGEAEKGIAAQLEAWIEEVKAALRAAYYEEEANTFAGGVQGAEAMALDIGLGNEAMARRMAKRYAENPAFDTGFLATGILIRQLFAQGDGPTAVRLLASDAEQHSFGWQRKQGATTLWERWNGTESRNHPMFGGCIQYLYEGLAGIQDRTGTDGGLWITPCLDTELTWVKAEAQTRFGRVVVAWEQQGQDLELDVQMPCRGHLVLGERTIELDAGEWHQKGVVDVCTGCISWTDVPEK